MPAAYTHFCAIQVGGEWRLVATMEDNSIRVFEMADGMLLEVDGIFGLPNLQHFEVFEVIPGAILIRSVNGDCQTRTSIYHVVKYVISFPRRMSSSIRGSFTRSGSSRVPTNRLRKLAFLRSNPSRRLYASTRLKLIEKMATKCSSSFH